MGDIGNMVPELINNYNVYLTSKLVGVSGELELPELEQMTETIEQAAGVGGEIEVPATGHFNSSKMTIPFAILHEDLLKFAHTGKVLDITLRAAEQFTDRTTGATANKGVVISIRGKCTKIAPGTMKRGGKGEAELEVEWTYIKIAIDGTDRLMIDKLNFKYEVNGVDILAGIRNLI